MALVSASSTLSRLVKVAERHLLLNPYNYPFTSVSVYPHSRISYPESPLGVGASSRHEEVGNISLPSISRDSNLSHFTTWAPLVIDEIFSARLVCQRCFVELEKLSYVFFSRSNLQKHLKNSDHDELVDMCKSLIVLTKIILLAPPIEASSDNIFSETNGALPTYIPISSITGPSKLSSSSTLSSRGTGKGEHLFQQRYSPLWELETELVNTIRRFNFFCSSNNTNSVLDRELTAISAEIFLLFQKRRTYAYCDTNEDNDIYSVSPPSPLSMKEYITCGFQILFSRGLQSNCAEYYPPLSMKRNAEFILDVPGSAIMLCPDIIRDLLLQLKCECKQVVLSLKDDVTSGSQQSRQQSHIQDFVIFSIKICKAIIDSSDTNIRGKVSQTTNAVSSSRGGQDHLCTLKSILDEISVFLDSLSKVIGAAYHTGEMASSLTQSSCASENVTFVSSTIIPSISPTVLLDLVMLQYDIQVVTGKGVHNHLNSSSLSISATFPLLNQILTRNRDSGSEFLTLSTFSKLLSVVSIWKACESPTDKTGDINDKTSMLIMLLLHVGLEKKDSCIATTNSVVPRFGKGELLPSFIERLPADQLVAFTVASVSASSSLSSQEDAVLFRKLASQLVGRVRALCSLGISLYSLTDLINVTEHIPLLIQRSNVLPQYTDCEVCEEPSCISDTKRIADSGTDMTAAQYVSQCLHAIMSATSNEVIFSHSNRDALPNYLKTLFGSSLLDGESFPLFQSPLMTKKFFRPLLFPLRRLSNWILERIGGSRSSADYDNSLTSFGDSLDAVRSSSGCPSLVNHYDCTYELLDALTLFLTNPLARYMFLSPLSFGVKTNTNSENPSSSSKRTDDVLPPSSKFSQEVAVRSEAKELYKGAATMVLWAMAEKLRGRHINRERSVTCDNSGEPSVSDFNGLTDTFHTEDAEFILEQESTVVSSPTSSGISIDGNGVLDSNSNNYEHPRKLQPISNSTNSGSLVSMLLLTALIDGPASHAIVALDALMGLQSPPASHHIGSSPPTAMPTPHLPPSVVGALPSTSPDPTILDTISLKEITSILHSISWLERKIMTVGNAQISHLREHHNNRKEDMDLVLRVKEACLRRALTRADELMDLM